jgi:branched-chain amino acid transport system substrate-binding protein
MDGFKSCLKNLGLEGKHEIVTAGIGVGGNNKEIYDCCEQLLFNSTDIIIAYINPATAEFIQSLFEASGKMLIVLDSGYHFRTSDKKLNNVHFISLEGGLCSRAIVGKAIEEGQSNFAFTCSFYDAGYRSPYTFSTALEDKGGDITYNHVTNLKRSEFDLGPLEKHLEENENVSLLASFCGDMAEDFFRESSKLKNITSRKTYGSGFTAEEFWMNQIPYPGYDWSCAVPWSANLSNKENEDFVSAMKNIKEQKANVFSLLGWEAALFIENSNGETLDDLVINSPRGKVFMNPNTGYSEAPVYYAAVVKNEETGNCRLDNITKVQNLDEERQRLQYHITAIQNTSSNSWFNSYPCLES